jgi:hypothetical protein
MLKHPQRFWLVALVIAWAVDFLFWEKPIGISFLIFTLLALAGGFGLAVSEKVRPARFSYLLGGLVIAMAEVTVIRGESFTRILNGLLALSGLLLLVMTFRTGGWIRFFLTDYIGAALELLVTTLVRASGLKIMPEHADGGSRRAFLRRLLPLLRGVLLALPVVALMAALLSSADLVFADQMNQLLENFNLAKAPEYLFRLFYILVLTYVFAGYYAHALFPTRWGSSTPEDAETAGAHRTVPGDTSLVKPFLGSTEAFIVLGSINLLFAFFVAIQFRYLFGGRANITAAGFTFADYARRGFFELVWVAVISLLLFLVLNAVTRRDAAPQRRVFTGLSMLLVSLVLVILVSAFLRLLLYEDAYGFTNLRTYTHLFIPWLGFLLLATIVLQIVHREQYFGALLLLTSFGFALTFGFFNIDQFIVQQNVARARAGMELDGQYLLTLSDDALPALAGEFQRSGQPAEIHDVLGAVLSCRSFVLDPSKDEPWQAYHPGNAASRRVYDDLDLTGYPVISNADGQSVEIKAGTFSCVPSPQED